MTVWCTVGAENRFGKHAFSGLETVKMIDKFNLDKTVTNRPNSRDG